LESTPTTNYTTLRATKERRISKQRRPWKDRLLLFSEWREDERPSFFHWSNIFCELLNAIEKLVSESRRWQRREGAEDFFVRNGSPSWPRPSFHR
jgi:hypothetical protein